MMDHENAVRKTKVVATIGPASWDEEVLRAMMRAGMDVARINFSHGEHDSHAETIAKVRKIAQEENRVVAVLCDLQGPKIRIGKLKDPLDLDDGEMLTLTSDPADGTGNIVPLPHPEIFKDICAGKRLLLDDGNLEFQVESATERTLVCKVVHGGRLESRKGLMAPDTDLTLSAITDKDRADIKFAVSQNADYLALSFVRFAEDIDELRQLMQKAGGDIAVIAKIEKHEALDHLEGIIATCDGVMVARGDLGLEIPVEEVPFYQKRIIKLCNKAAKPVIVATQMLSSMVESPRPTRAEASDVYNAIVDGTDAVMLSNETTVGEFPVESVRTMTRIATFADVDSLREHPPKRMLGGDIHAEVGQKSISNAISEAVYHISELLNLRAILTMTLTGYTARLVAHERPHTAILCVTPNEVTYRRMALVWGVKPLLVPRLESIDEMIEGVVEAALNEGVVDRGDTVVIVMGAPFYVGGQTNMLKIHKIAE
jgi:pyruvate kinase